MTTHKVHLADAPTDVLVFLAEHAGTEHDKAAIVAAVAPADGLDTGVTVSLALNLLLQLGHARRTKAGFWQVTDQGLTAVQEAQGT